ncbi:hypothetical protein E1265_09285 [Streptomyces sp. 8K308]|uniref:DUF6519 domain-containing protein n=1 Tax=Streptomyces sp. 8K308 TaxID=2530388 RepID=UPI001047773E|nr:DUF6519 domain-containing protein [Streptomyces sp. 8K308]TDC24597.1 hypothetical protein E1265_09285 [Streptomyces sp. 8K308]
MYGDLSRVTFRPARNYAAVLHQQGRVQLDADANEQIAIQLHHARALAADLIGPHGGPARALGFAIGYVPGNRELDDLIIGGGRYYVDGIPLDAGRPAPGVPAEAGRRPESAPDEPAPWTYWEQPDAHLDPELAEDRLPDELPYLVYLDVWERAVNAAEDPEIREIALGGVLPDTAARIKTLWQVRALPAAELGEIDGEGPEARRAAFAEWAAERQSGSAWLAARAERPEGADDKPCLVRPDARYRGPENQLYRIEIHDGGTAERDATFKWSRDNGSVVFPIVGLDGGWLELATLGGDGKLDLNAGDWVEVVDTAYASRQRPAPLLQVEEVDLPGRRVRLSDEPAPGVGAQHHNPYLRRWDQRPTGGRGGGKVEGALPIAEGVWLDLEDGVQVYFEPGGSYRAGDHWVTAARTVTGTVEWPRDVTGEPLLQGPAGVAHHYAPLAWIAADGSVEDLRFAFGRLAGPVENAIEG